MTVDLKENRKYIIAAVICFLVLPHLPQILFPEFYQAVLANGNTPVGLAHSFDNWTFLSLFHNHCAYLLPCFLAGILGLIHVRREKKFCPILPLTAVLSALTFLLWETNTWAAVTMLVSAVLLTLIDALGFLGRFYEEELEPEPDKPRWRRLLCGAGQNLRFLAALAYWLLAIPVWFQVNFTLSEIGNYSGYLLFAFMLYVPFVALLLPLCQLFDDETMTAGGMLVSTVLFLLSAGVCACVDSCGFRFENLLLVGGSYLLFVLTEGVLALYRQAVALWQRHKAKKTSADGSAA